MLKYQKMSPEKISDECSREHIRGVLERAKNEILAMSAILRVLAYPRRGTGEEQLTLENFADLVQKNYKLSDFED